MAYLYRHIRLDKNVPFYIGISNNINHKRAYTFSGRSLHWKNIVKKSGYRVEIILDNITYEKAKEKEKELIKFYGRKDLGLGILVNFTDGGDGSVGLLVSDATRIKNGLAAKGYKHTDEAKRKISEAQKGNKYRLGQKATEETKKKMSLSHMGNKGHAGKFSASHIEKLKEFQNKPENKIRASIVGRALKHTPEAKEKIRLSSIGRNHSKPVYCITNKTTYKSITEAAKILKINLGNISSVCTGKKKHASGYIFNHLIKKVS